MLIGAPDGEGGQKTVPAGREVELPEDDARRLARHGGVVILDETLIEEDP